MSFLQKFFCIAVFSIFTQTISAQNYQLVWSDEFNGTELNTDDWAFETGPNPANNESQYYTSRPENCTLKEGMLVITGKKENYGGMSYTSARIKTKQNWEYGKFEARIKLPYGKGIWPAFWMLGKNISSVGWPACGELDIMELTGGGNGDKTVYGTAHWDQNGHAQYGLSYSLSSGKFADDFHVFTATWDPQKIQWYVDGFKYCTIDITPSALSEFHNQFYIILNLAIGGNWPGYPDNSTVFPQVMYVDYVRVYQDASSIPSINLIEPTDNSIYNNGANFSLKSNIDYDGKIQKVEFFQGAAKIGETDVEPFEWSLENVPSGCYKFSAKAITEKGFSTNSNEVSVTVGSCGEAPYKANAAVIPGTIEAENYDLGGAEVAYHDADAANSGGSYRPNDGVDIQECEDINGGYNIGWVSAGEWLAYSVLVSTDGSYNFESRLAASSGGGIYHFEIDGNDVTGPINVSGTGGWQTWATFVKQGVHLSQGTKIFKIVIDQGEFNLNKIDVVPAGVSSQIKLISPNGNEVWGKNFVHEIKWESVKVSDLQIGYSTDGGIHWNFVTTGTPAAYGTYRWLVPNIDSDSCKVMLIDKNNSSLRAESENTFTITQLSDVKDENLIKDYSLKQNYPNPFNPSTTINFSIPKSEFVSLKVYDILGREISTLINEAKNAGNYSLDFHAENLPSGIYFYKITSGSFSELKKMILLR